MLRAKVKVGLIAALAAAATLVGAVVPAFAQHETGHHHMSMSGALGDYAATREASGSAWQPENAPMDGRHFMLGDWMFMAHGTLSGIYDHQGGHRGDRRTFASGMFMLMGTTDTAAGRFGVRGMLSPEPLMGKRGYPLLLQTGETADGRTELIDRQHPHDLFMELAGTWSGQLSEHSSVFLYAGFPGEPALGPAAFMHRASAEEIPDAPITHHWLDSTHIVFGVLTAGVVVDNFKLEASRFNGREPDQFRYNIDTAALDSYSFRATWNPGAAWSLQASTGTLRHSEQLDPDLKVRRTTLSASYVEQLDEMLLAVTAAWGRNDLNPGRGLDGALLEASLRRRERHVFFSRLEHVQKSDLLESAPDRIFRVSRLSAGYLRELGAIGPFAIGLGGELSWSFLPDGLEHQYGGDPLSFLVFLRGKLV